MNIIKGQKIWVWQDRCGVSETVVKTVGRKYITVESPSRIKFRISDLRENDGCGLPAYLITDLDEYNKKCHYADIRRKLYRMNWNKISEENLDKIEKILNI